MKRIIVLSALLISLISLFGLCAYAETAETATANTAGAETETKAEEFTPPEISILLSNAETGSRNASPGKKTAIKVRVLYSGAEKGKSYVLVLRLEEASSGVLCRFSDGRDFLKESFTADGEVGFHEFEFELDAALYPGRTLSELHTLEGLEWAYVEHDKQEQGHIYVPIMNSEAFSTAGEKKVLAGKHSVICNVVSYYGLAPDEEYRIVSGLRDVASGKEICGDNGEPIRACSRFTPTASSGQIAARINADLTEYGNRSISVFEEIYLLPPTGEPRLLMSGGTAAGDEKTVCSRFAEISVIDEMNRTPVSNVALKVTSVTDGTVYEGVTNMNGKCSLPLNADRKYVCEVSSVPDNYLSRGDSIEFTPSESDTKSALSITLLRKNTVVLRRTDAATGLAVQGIVTEVRDSKGKLLSTVFSDSNGREYFDANPYMKDAAKGLTLYFTDSSTPSMYYPKESTWTVSIDGNGSISGLLKLQSIRRSPIAISVQNGKREGIPGVTLSIIGSDGSIQGSAVTDHEGKIYFTPKRTGTYMLVEDTIPAGYARSMGTKKITVGEDGGIRGSLTITNLSEDFTVGVTTVLVMLAVLLPVWASRGFVLKKPVGENTAIEYSGKHRKHRDKRR